MSVASLIGFRWFERRRGGWDMRLSWAEVSGGFGLALAVCLFSAGHRSLHIHLGWPNIFIRLPLPRRWCREPYETMEQWGFTWCGPASVHLNWGRRCKVIYMPWAWEWVRTSLLLADGTWAHQTRLRKAEFPNYPLAPSESKPFGTWHKLKDEYAWRETYPYRYVRRSGEVQERKATVTVEEREWRWRWFAWLPFPRMVQRSIDVKFSDEVGERTGSWKGGCVGCGYDLRFNEMPQESLGRMAHERRFD